MIEIWRDGFSQGAYGYGSSFENWFDSVNHISVDPRATDSLYDVVADRPIDKLEIESINGNKLHSYTVTSYEYNLDYYKRTKKKYNAEQDQVAIEVSYVEKANPKQEIADLGNFIKASVPTGLSYITRALKPKQNDSDPIRSWVATNLSQITGRDAEDFLDGAVPEVSAMLVPTNSPPTKGSGEYDTKKLKLSNDMKLILSQAEVQDGLDRGQFEEAVKKYTKTYLKKVAGKSSEKVFNVVDDLVSGKSVAKSVIKLSKDKYVEGAVTSFINKVHIRYANHEFTRSLLNYKPQREAFTQFIEDSLGLGNFFVADGSSIASMLLVEKFKTKVEDGKAVSATLAMAAKKKGIAVTKAKGEYFIEKEEYKHLQVEIEADTTKHLESLESKYGIDKSEYDNLSNTTIGSMRYKAVTSIIDGAYGAYSAINDLNEELHKLQSQDGVLDNAVVCMGIYKQIFEMQANCVNVINECNNYRLNRMLKAVPSTQLFGSIEKEIGNSIARRKSLSSLLKTNEVITGSLGLGISTLQLMQSMRSIVRDMNKNDDHVLRSDIATFINAGSGTVSAAQGIAKTLQGEASKVAEKATMSTANLLGRNVTTDVTKKVIKKEVILSGVERLGVRAGAALTVPYLGEVLLAIDVITTLWQAIEESRKDNIYQIWIKLAGLSNVK